MKLLNHKNKAVLKTLYANKPLPAFIHLHTVERMKNEQLIRVPRPLLQNNLTGIAVAALILTGCIAAGYFFGQSKTTRQPQPIAANLGKEKFVLLVHNDDTPPANPNEQFEVYAKWLADIKASRFADGEALHGDRTIIAGTGGQVEIATQPLPPNNREAVSGFFIFEADNAADAQAIARTCPHLRYGGTLELRQVFQ
jgi:hypothetical protein